MASIGFAEIIIQEATMTPSVKNERASLIFLLLRVDKYRYVTKKLAELAIDALITKKTPIKPRSTLPIAVKRVLAEKGVIIAQPGKTSFAFRSIAQKIPSSSEFLLVKVF